MQQALTVPSHAEIERLLDAATAKSAGSRELVELRQAMTISTDHSRTYDLAAVAERALIKAFPTEKAFKAITQGRIAALRLELGGEQPSPLDRLLIDQVVLTYLYLNQVEYQLSTLWDGTSNRDVIEFWEDRVARSQKRHLRAVECLARVRRLLNLPPVQINFAERLLNITGKGNANGDDIGGEQSA